MTLRERKKGNTSLESLHRIDGDNKLESCLNIKNILPISTQYEILSSVTSETVVLFDFSGQPLYASPATGSARGYTLEEVCTLPLKEQLTHESYQKLRDIYTELKKAAAEGNGRDKHPHDIDLEFICKDGTSLWRETHLEIAYEGNGLPLGILAVSRHINREMVIRKELQQQRDLFEELVQNAPVGICILDDLGKATYINHEAEFILGIPRSEKLPDDFFISSRYLHDLDGKPLPNADIPFLKVKDTGDRLFAQTLTLEQDEGRIIISMNMSPIVRSDQEKFGAILVFEDITERFYTRQSLYETRLQYVELFNSMNNGVATFEVICNENGEPADFRFVDVNNSFEKMTGLKRKEVLGKTFHDLFSEVEHHWMHKDLEIAYLEKAHKFFEFVKLSGKWLNITIYSPALGQQVMIFEEVTSQRLHEITQTLSLAINQLFTQAKDVSYICMQIPELIAKELDFYISGYELFSDNREKVAIRLNANTKKPIRTKIDADQSILQRLHNVDHLIIDSYHPICEEDLADPFLANETIQSCIALPIRYQGVVTGAIILADAAPFAGFEQILDMLNEIVSQVENHVAQFVTEKELEQSEVRFRAIFENAASGIALLTPKGKFVQVNAALATMLEKTPAELVGADLTQSVLPKYEELITQAMGEIIGNRKTSNEAEIQFQGLSSQAKWGLIKFAAIRSEKGEIEYVLAMVDDISERIKAQDFITLSNARLEALEHLNEICEKSTREITHYTMEQAIRLTRSEVGYIAFVNREETSLTMYAWSESMVPGSDLERLPVEFKIEEAGLWAEVIRQRKPIVVNDYAASHLPKKGYPHGHVKLLRYLNAPIFEAERIVVLAGVANKADDYDETDIRQLTLLMTGMWNILQRKESLEALRKSEAQTRMIVETASEGIWTLDLDNRSIFVNQRMAEILGYSVAELTNHQVQEFFPQEDRKVYTDPMTLRKPGEVDRYEIRMVRKDGSLIWCLVSATNMLDAQGNTIGSIAMLSDITERKLAEEAVRESRRILQLVLDTIPQRVFWKDNELRYIGANRNFLYDLGMKSLDELTGKDDFQLTSAEFAATYRNDDNFVMQNNLPKLQIEEQQLTSVGSKLWTRTNKVPLHDETGKVTGVLGTYEDVTEYRKASKQLQESEERFRNLAVNAPVGIYETNLEGISTYINERWKEITGLHDLESRDDGWLQGIHPDDLERVIHEWKNTKKKFRDFNLEYRRIKPDGTVVWVADRERPYKGSDGKIRSFIGTITDITELKQKEQEIKESLSLNQATLESTESGILAVDLQGNVTNFNQKLFEMWGLNVVDVEDLTYPKFVSKLNSMLRTREDYVAFLANVNSHPLERSRQVLRLKNGSVFEELSIPQMLDNHQIGRVWSYQDVTSRYVADEQLRRNYEEMELMVNRLGALRNIDTAITGHSTFHEIVSDIMPNVTRSLGVDAALLLIPHLDTDQLAVVGQDGFKANILGLSILERMVVRDNRFTGKVYRERKPVFIPIANNPDPKENPALRFDESFASYAAIPLIAKNEVKGVLEVFSRKPMNVQRDWKEFFHSLAMQVAIAIDNADLFNRMEHTNLELLAAYEATIEGWARALELRDKETLGHSERVIDLTLRLASLIGIPREEFAQLRRGVLLHDIGKMGVPDNILLKPGPLTDDEWVIMKQHPTFAYEMLSGIPYLREALDVPYCHHERWDGSGYPRGLAGEKIPLAARIFSIVDVWDALTSKRPYRPAWREQDTKAYIRDQGGKQFDPRVVEAFLKMLE